MYAVCIYYVYDIIILGVTNNKGLKGGVVDEFCFDNAVVDDDASVIADTDVTFGLNGLSKSSNPLGIGNLANSSLNCLY